MLEQKVRRGYYYLDGGTSNYQEGKIKCETVEHYCFTSDNVRSFYKCKFKQKFQIVVFSYLKYLNHNMKLAKT